MKTRSWLLCAAFFVAVGCATVHRATISEIRPVGNAGGSLDVKASETGFDVRGAAQTTRNLTHRYGNSNARNAGSMLNFAVQMSSWSPATGNPTVSETWADAITVELRERCSGGRVSNIAVIRESASYPYISGEIVRVKAECLR
jgi:hypothetical protein